MPGFSIVYARNKDHSVTGANNQNYNEKFTLTKDFKLASGNKIKIWYMHEDVGLDSKLFTGSNSDGEVNWYGIRYKTGPMEFQYSYGDSDANEGPTYDRDGYNIGMYYKLSKTSRIYLAHSKSDAGSGDGGKTATITGTDTDGAAQTEVITLAGSATAVAGTKIFLTVTAVEMSSQPAANITVGFGAVGLDDSTFFAASLAFAICCALSRPDIFGLSLRNCAKLPLFFAAWNLAFLSAAYCVVPGFDAISFQEMLALVRPNV